MKRIFVLGALTVACGETLTGLPNQPGGNPLVPEIALYPFPSSYYFADGKLNFPRGILPDGLPDALFEELDGYTITPAILTAFPRGVDPATLPAAEDAGATLRDDSPIFLVRVADNRRVPLLAELDAYATDPARTSLILRPHVALAFDSDYVVILRDRLKAQNGAVLPPSEAFRALRDGIDTDSEAVERQRADFEKVNATIEAQNLDPEEVILAWIFHTRREAPVTAPLLAMHDHYDRVPLPPCVLTSDALDGDGNNRLIQGTVRIPTFLDGEERVRYDAENEPIVQGEKELEFLVTIPAAITTPRPVVTFGHGFFSDKFEAARASGNRSLRRWNISAISTDFVGFNKDRMLETGLVFAGAFQDLDRVVSLQMESQATFTVLARLVKEQLADQLPVLDREAVHYLGISNGGTQGAPILAASPQFRRGVLVVPGAGLTHMVQRGEPWNMIAPLLMTTYPDPVDIQLALALVQHTFDAIDGMSFAAHLVGDRFPGRPPLELTMHEAVADSQVANIATEWLARTANVPLMLPAAREIWGFAPHDAASGRSALFVYDEQRMRPPPGNKPPAEDNGAHESLRNLEVYNQHVGQFLETGEIIQLCDGACDPT